MTSCLAVGAGVFLRECGATRIGGMPLPILDVRHEPSRADLVRLFHRTQGAWVGHLADEVLLEAGSAHVCAELSGIPDANHVRDAALPAGVSAGRALAEVE